MNGPRLDVNRLAELLLSRPEKAPVVSLYLAHDPGSPATTEVRLKDLVKEGAATIEREQGLDASSRDRALAALDSAGKAMSGEIEEHSRGSSIVFAGDGRIDVFHVPCALKTRVVVGWRPYLGPLAGLVEHADRYGVVVADHREARIFSFFLGELEELSSFEDAAAQNVAWAGWFGRDQLKANHHRDLVFQRHLQHTADALFAHHKRTPFDRIVLAGHPPATLSKLERSLHPYLAGRVVARESWEHRSLPDDLRAGLREIDERVETEKERRLISRVRDHAAGDLLAVTGADATLSALWSGRAATVLVPEGAKIAGAACEQCRFLTADGGKTTRCRECKGPTRRLDDLVEEASELAVLTGAKVRLVGRAKAELESLGNFAALLRYA